MHFRAGPAGLDTGVIMCNTPGSPRCVFQGLQCKAATPTCFRVNDDAPDCARITGQLSGLMGRGLQLNQHLHTRYMRAQVDRPGFEHAGL